MKKEIDVGEAQCLFDAKGIAVLLGVSLPTVRKWTKEGELPAIRFNCGRSVRYDWPSVREHLLRKQQVGQ
jgi:excisionase family DNA binding protein